jgi:2-keto-4-pentenoate hydratase
MTSTAHDRLSEARATRQPCAPVRDVLKPDDLAAAYAVQTAWVSDQLAAGDRLIGRKIGLTSPAVQKQMGVDRPDFGTLLAAMACPEDAPIDYDRLLQPKIEAEVAFILARDLDGDHISQGDVLAATGAVVPALEIVDSRIAGWDITLVDTVADNASSGLFTLGQARHRPGELDLAACEMRLWRGDELVSEGSGAACLGHPAAAVAWLANTAREYGQPLRKGEIILSGALGPMIPVGPGDQFTAEISGLGRVSAVFTGGSQ